VEQFWKSQTKEDAPYKPFGSGNAAKMGIPEGVNSLVLVEGIDCDASGKPERVHKELAQQISSLVLKHVTSGLPSIAFCTMGVPKEDLYRKNAGLDIIRLLEVSVPVILIDSRPRPKKREAEHPGVSRGVPDKLQDANLQGTSRKELTREEKRVLRVKCAIEEFEARCNKMLAKNADFSKTGQLHAELHQNASIALLHAALLGDDIYGHRRGSSKQQVVYLHQAIKNVQKMRMEDPLNEEDGCVSRCCDALLSNFLIAGVMCEFEDKKEKHALLSEITSLKVDILTDERFKPLVEASQALSGSIRSEWWMKFHTLLTSRQITGIHLDDLNGSAAKTRFQNIALAEAEWLPSAQNESGLLMLRHAWNCSDILEHEAVRYKGYAKFLNAFILILGIFITIITIIGTNSVISSDHVKGVLTDLPHSTSHS
jgi:hypothetical protein